MNPAEIHTLTGAYALDALPEDERRAFEEHLAQCAACRQEVDEFAVTAAELGASGYETPPADLKASVMAEIDTVRQEVPVTRLTPLRSRRLATALTAAAASIAVFVAVALGIQSSRIAGERDEVRQELAQVLDVVTSDDATTLETTGPEGSTATVVASPSLGEAVFIASGMPEAPRNQVYELWLISSTGAEPAGLLDIDNGQGTHVMRGDMSGVVAIGVTVEPAGGSSQPTSDPIMLLEL